MDTERSLPPELLDRFNVTSPDFIEETHIATIWKVRCVNEEHAALKLYHNQDMRNEKTGFDFISAKSGTGTANLLGLSHDAALLEWLEGPSLGDLTRNGDDNKANAELVAVANRIHGESASVKSDLPHLEEWFDALFQLQFHQDCSTKGRLDLLFCKEVARDLLATQTDVTPLHGDLHHDNIRLGARGFCAFDAKGILGERAYELANAFRNPKGAHDTVADPERVRRLAQNWSRDFKVDQHRLLGWAMVKSALSISWKSGGEFRDDAELELLSILRAEYSR